MQSKQNRFQEEPIKYFAKGMHEKMLGRFEQ
jgi:hypothetical protein